MRNAYHCHNCGVDFLIDLDESETKFCPLCAAAKPTLYQSMTGGESDAEEMAEILQKFRASLGLDT